MSCRTCTPWKGTSCDASTIGQQIFSAQRMNKHFGFRYNLWPTKYICRWSGMEWVLVEMGVRHLTVVYRRATTSYSYAALTRSRAGNQSHFTASFPFNKSSGRSWLLLCAGFIAQCAMGGKLIKHLSWRRNLLLSHYIWKESENHIMMHWCRIMEISSRFNKINIIMPMHCGWI